MVEGASLFSITERIFRLLRGEIMIRSLLAKTIVPVALTAAGFIVVSCILLYTTIKQDMIHSAVQYETNLAQVVVKSTRQTMLKDDRDTLRNVISNIGQMSGVEHVRIFNKKGIIMFSRDGTEVNRAVDKQVSGCIECHRGAEPSQFLGKMEQARRFTNDRGQEILAITAPIYNAPDCFTAACHAHQPDQKILGTLDLGLDQAPLRKELATLRYRMVSFGVLLLLLTVTGIAALLKRSILDPISRLARYTGGLRRGGQAPPFPALKGDLAQIAGDIRQLTQERQSATDEHGGPAGPPASRGDNDH